MNNNFTDNRSKKICFVAHCILNSNSRVNPSGTSNKYPGSVDPVIDLLQEHDIGIEQLPCVERLFSYCRSPTAKQDMDTPGFREHCREKAGEVVDTIQKFSELGVKTLFIIGMRCSPSCGVKKVYVGGEKKFADEKGIFMEELEKALAAINLSVPMLDFEREDLEGCLTEIKKSLE